MLARRIREVLVPAVLAAVAVGCDTSQPGAGFTNGPEPAYSPEKPAVRDDLPPPDLPDADVPAPDAGKGPEGGPGTDAGTGGRGGGRGGVEPADPEGAEGRDSVRATPPTIEAPGGNSASGDAKPQDGIKVGTPRSPQL